MGKFKPCLIFSEGRKSIECLVWNRIVYIRAFCSSLVCILCSVVLFSKSIKKFVLIDGMNWLYLCHKTYAAIKANAMIWLHWIKDRKDLNNCIAKCDRRHQQCCFDTFRLRYSWWKHSKTFNAFIMQSHKCLATGIWYLDLRDLSHFKYYF